nr:MAG TPA: hypothetical protein [Bacteriophage sp.]
MCLQLPHCCPKSTGLLSAHLRQWRLSSVS